MNDLQSEKQKYIETHMAVLKEYFVEIEKYYRWAKEQIKIIEKINKKNKDFHL